MEGKAVGDNFENGPSKYHPMPSFRTVVSEKKI
jgi:hypothetical protein